MRKFIWAAISLALVSLALAQVVMLQGAKGEGAARAEDGRIGLFRFDVKKYFLASGRTEVDGPLRFESGPTATSHDPRHVVIEMAHARHFGKHENVAEFGGPGVMAIRTADGVHHREGRVVVRVQDNRRPTDPNFEHPDTFAIKFYVTNTDIVFGFAGRVLRGDLMVYHRN
jgi:hypothetical protein